VCTLSLGRVAASWAGTLFEVLAADDPDEDALGSRDESGAKVA
jgi:hypothetical protein